MNKLILSKLGKKTYGRGKFWSGMDIPVNTQKAATVTMQDKDDQKIYIRKRSRPEVKAGEIYDALNYKHQPWIRKSVLPEKDILKIETPDNRDD